MPTTSYTNSTFSVAAVGNRTDSAGTPVADYTAEEARFVLQVLTEGYLKPATSFKVVQQSVPDMSVKVGSGTAKADYYVVQGETGGQGNYLVRLDVTSQSVTVPAADASQPRVDEIYLVVRDNGYDASSRGLPQIGYRKGDLGGALPGPDSSWEASVLLATVAVAALASSIGTANITDGRVASALLASLAGVTDHGALTGLADDDHTQYHNNTRGDARYIQQTLPDAKGDLFTATAADTPARLAVGTNGQVLTAASGETTGIKWAANPAKLSAVDVQVFTASGTWTKPAGAVTVTAQVVGGGGGGGGSLASHGGGGGGGGGYSSKTFAAGSLSATESVTIGAGGARGLASSNGSDGGTSSFAGVTSGYGAGGVATGGGGFSYDGSGGDINTAGGDGMANVDVFGGHGGVSYFGGMSADTTGGLPGGSGGGGGYWLGSPDPAFAGGSGVVVITTYVAS